MESLTRWDRFVGSSRLGARVALLASLLGLCTCAPGDWSSRTGALQALRGAPKVEICHLPPGNPDDWRTLTVGESAVAAHVENHGDLVGSCDEVCHILCDDGNACTLDCVDGACTTDVPVDCDDGDPGSSDTCDEEVGCLHTETACDDWADNDADGATDCDDSDCEGNPACGCPTSENFADWWGIGSDCMDEYYELCESDFPTSCCDYCAECVSEAGCEGCPELSGCRSELCSDNADNDLDGATDCEDSDCAEDASCQTAECGCDPPAAWPSYDAGCDAGTGDDGWDQCNDVTEGGCWCETCDACFYDGDCEACAACTNDLPCWG